MSEYFILGQIRVRLSKAVQILLANVVHVVVVKLLRKCSREDHKAAVLPAHNIF
jgi:hypothetical protein